MHALVGWFWLSTHWVGVRRTGSKIARGGVLMMPP